MVSNCANPGCRRPLHYLREGRVFLFNPAGGRGDRKHRPLEHYWLCGECAQCMTLVKDDVGVHVIYRPALEPESRNDPPGAPPGKTA
jgi:hypothetical protein